MASEWQEMRLEDCMEAIIDYRGKTPNKTESGIPLITAKIIKNGRIEPVTEFIAEDEYDTWMRRGIPKPGDIVMTTEAPLGEIAQLDNRKIALAQRVITLRGRADLLDNTYLKYLMLSNYVQHQLDGRGTGTTVKGIKQSELREVLLKFPSIEAQQFIGNILGTLDAKIELNRQTNQTLESMAQALFKSWFVDFDPVIDNALEAGNAIPEPLQARAEQRKDLRESSDALDGQAVPQLPEAIRQLFPSSFVLDAEMGWIPEGWEIGCLEDMIVLQRGFDLPKSNRTSGAYPLIVASGQDGTHSEYKVSGPGVVTGRSGKLGEVMFVHEDFWPLNTTLWVKEYKNSNPYHAYHLLQTLGLDQYNSGSAVPTLNRNHVHNMRLLVPAKNVVDQYQSNVASLFSKLRHNEKASEMLANLRDTLLPKLISGELRIPEAVQAVQEIEAIGV